MKLPCGDMVSTFQPNQTPNFSDRTNSTPTLWVDSIDGLEDLAQDFQLKQPSDTPTAGEHIIALTSERDVRRVARLIQPKGNILGIIPPMKLLADSIAIILNATKQPFDLWDKTISQTPLEFEDAYAIARDARQSLQSGEISSSQWNIEKEKLRKRCNVSPFDWNQYIKDLEAEIHATALEKSTARQQLELQALAQEKNSIKFTNKLIDFCRRSGWTRTDALQEIRRFKVGTKTPKAKRLKGKDFLAKETEALSWVFPGQIPARGITVLGGVAGSGKSTLAYDAAVSLLLNEEFLGEKPAKKGKVLIVSSDELPCFIQDKLIDRGMPLGNEDWEILTDWDVSQWDLLEETIEDIKPAFVLMDSFSSIHRDPNFDENSTQAKMTIYDLEALSNTYEFGCILIHHLSKGKDNKGVAKLRGSSAIAAACSVVALLEENPDGSRMLSFPKVRGAQTNPMRIALNPQTGRYSLLLGGDSALTKTLAQQILDFLSQEPSKRFTPEEIFQSLGLTNKDSGHQALRRCFQRGQVVKRPNRAGRGSVYGIGRIELTPLPPPQQSVPTQQDPLPPFIEKVSVQIAETVEVQPIEVADTLTDTPSIEVSQCQGEVEGILWNDEFTPAVKRQKLAETKSKRGQSVYETAIARLSTDDRADLENLRRRQ